jgi:hypothetical protein
MMKRIAFVSALFFALAGCGPEDHADKSGAIHPVGTTSLLPAVSQVVSTAAHAAVPTFIWAGQPAPTASRPPTAELAARAHLANFAQHYRLAPAQVPALELRDLHDTGRGAIIARFGRRIDGIEVFGEQVAVAMDRNFNALALTGFVTGDLPASSSGAVRFTLEPRRAIVAAIAEPSRIKSVFFRARSKQLVPSYYVETDLGPDAEGEPRYFAYVISAGDGSVLWKKNLTAYDNPYTYRVYADDSGLFMPWDGPEGTTATPNPTATLDKFQAPFVPANLVTLSSLQSVGVEDPWLPPGATETLGNNVDAYLDIFTPDGFTPGRDFRGSVSATGVFDYTFDTGIDANANTTQQNAAVTQLFYNNNWFHDWYYAAGFTEAAGNAQFSNYGRGGVEGDGLRAEAQDSSGKNNANMSTPADGARPRMQMYLWDFGHANTTVTAPASIAGTYTSGAAGFSPANFNISGDVVRANPLDGCAALVGDYAGKIVLIDRTPCPVNSLPTKAQNAQTAGAIGAIIANVATSPNPGVPPNPGGTPAFPITIGVLSLNLADGDLFRARLDAGETVSATLFRASILRDGDIDQQIVAHEWGHYISNRLVFNAAGLGTNMSGGLGEGWGDFHAMLITVRPEDTSNPTNANWNGVYALGGYATGALTADPYFWGVRRYPYSTDMTKDPLTFQHISDAVPLPASVPRSGLGAANNSEVHNTGEIWATMLWECYASILRDTLGDSPRLTFVQARERMRDYLVAAYKMTPANPTLLEARDAVLAAALANDPIDYQHFTEAFAKRGAGVFAIAPDRFDATNTPVVESYAFGAAVLAKGATLTDDVKAVCNADGILDNGETGTLRVTFQNVGNSASGALTATVTTTNEAITFPDGPTITIPPTAIGGTAEGSVHVAAAGLSGITGIELTVQVADAGAGAPPPSTYGFVTNADERANQSFTDTAESSHVVWTVVPSVPDMPADSLWHRAALATTDHVYSCPSSPLASTVDFVSPPLPVIAGQAFTLSFRHRYSFEFDTTANYDAGVIETSTDNGTTWTDVGQALAGYNGTVFNGSGNPLGGRPAFVASSAGYPAFANLSLDLGTGYGGKTVLVRFRVGSDSGTASPGWDIDDITVSGVATPPFDDVVAQPACNNQPIAVVGLNQSVPETGPAPSYTPTTVILDGSASLDPDGNPLTYLWSQLAGPAVTLSDATVAQPTFLAPQVTATTALRFQLVVNDGTIASVPKFTTVTVTNVNRPPTANAGPAQTVDERSVVALDGSASSDPDGTVLTFTWTPPEGITLSSNSVANPTFTAPEVTTDTPLTFGLVVSDGAATSSASVTITVRNVNRAPVASAGANQTVVERTVVTLDGSASVDPDGDAVTYLWTAPAGIVLSSATAATTTFTAPNVGPAGRTFTFSLVVTDAQGAASAPSTVQVAVTNRRRGR